MLETSRRFAILLGLSLAASACGAQTGSSVPAADGWSAVRLTGKTLRLVSDQDIEIYTFTTDNFVSVTLGSPGGPTIGPLWRWRISQGELVFTSERGERGLAFVSRSGTRISARRRTGETATYELEN